jgi:alpha-methylacyl-CoA racemase
VLIPNFRYFWLISGKDACAVPVLTPAEAVVHSTPASAIPHPHPRLLRTPAPASVTGSAAALALETAISVQPGAHTADILCELGISQDEQRMLTEEGAIGKIGRLSAAP